MTESALLVVDVDDDDKEDEEEVREEVSFFEEISGRGIFIISSVEALESGTPAPRLLFSSVAALSVLRVNVLFLLFVALMGGTGNAFG
tara:strand:+ start:2789 stop:3052 length:264 start_codon:yes stop_codon:yes gene_type:complete